MASGDVATEGQVAALTTAVSDAVIALREASVIIWTTGDSDPTVGGTVTIPSETKFIFVLATAATRPTWAPTGSVVIRS